MGKDKGGRPQHQLDYVTLDKLCGIMCTKEEIASLMEIDEDTLHNALVRDGHGGFSVYYKNKSANGKMSLRRVQYQAAIEGNTTMLVWLGKQHLGQVDKQEIKSDVHVAVKDIREMSDDELRSELDNE